MPIADAFSTNVSRLCMFEVECWSPTVLLVLRWGEGRGLFLMSHEGCRQEISKKKHDEHEAKIVLWRSGRNITPHPWLSCQVAPVVNDFARDGAVKLRTCEVCACTKIVIVIRPERMSLQSQQLQTASDRELWWQTERGEWGPTERTVWFGAGTSCAQTQRQHDEEENVLGESTVCT